MDEKSIFLEALDKGTPEERAEYLDEVCGTDGPVRERIEALLRQHEQSGSFLERPASAFDATVVPESPDRVAAREAGLGSAFTIDHAVVVGEPGHSVLKSIGKSHGEMPRVVLRDAAEEEDDPVQKPGSAEIPKQQQDSRYQLQGEIARGGMGAVLKGRDTDLGRDLAIKVLLDAHRDNPDVLQRFVEEAQIGGQLQHPGIAPVYELGQFADERPFFSMKLVKGQTLAKLLSGRENAADERSRFVGIFEQICQTMAYAHSRGVIHRDLKPANVMVGAFGEVQVMDWGLAKVLSTGGVADEQTSLEKHRDESLIQTRRTTGSDVPGSVGSVGSETQMGSVLGTPAYMPPEQALGEVDRLDKRADVFGLGALLCEILTGKPPYVGEDGTQVFRMAIRGKVDDAFARLDACGADAELITLAKDCLAVEPAERSKDAGVLAERVTSYLESVEQKLRETELAKVDAQVRAEELRRRQKLAYTAGTVIVATLLIGISVSLWQMNRAIDAETLANDETKRATAAEIAAKEEAARAEQERIRAETAHYAGQLTLAGIRIDDDDLPAAIEQLASTSEKVRNWEYERLLARCRARFGLLHDDYAFFATAMTRDGRLIAGGGRHPAVQVFDVETRTLVAEFPGKWSTVRALSFSPDGTRLACATSDSVHVWNVATRNQLGSIQLGPPPKELPFQAGGERHPSVAFDEDGGRLALGLDGEIQIWNGDLSIRMQSLEVGPGLITSVAFDPERNQLAARRYAGITKFDDSNPINFPGAIFQLFDLESGRVMAEDQWRGNVSGTVSYDPRGRWIVFVGFLREGERYVETRDPKTGAPSDSPLSRLRIENSMMGLAGGSFDADGSHFVCVDFANPRLLVIDTETGEMDRELRLPPGGLAHARGVATSGEWVAVASADDILRPNDAGAGRLSLHSFDDALAARSLASHSRGSQWPRSEIAICEPAGWIARAVTYTGVPTTDSANELTRNEVRAVEFHSLESQKFLFALRRTGTVRALLPSGDGRRMAVLQDSSIDVWDVAERRKESSVQIPAERQLHSALISPSGEQLAVVVSDEAMPRGAPDRTARSLEMHDLALGRLTWTVEYPSSVKPREWTTDGRLLVSSRPRPPRPIERDPATGLPILPVDPETGRFKPDDPSQLQVLDTATGEIQSTSPEFSTRVGWARFHPNGDVYFATAEQLARWTPGNEKTESVFAGRFERFEFLREGSRLVGIAPTSKGGSGGFGQQVLRVLDVATGLSVYQEAVPKSNSGIGLAVAPSGRTVGVRTYSDVFLLNLTPTLSNGKER